jgi:hypothetical protein
MSLRTNKRAAPSDSEDTDAKRVKLDEHSLIEQGEVVIRVQRIEGFREALNQNAAKIAGLAAEQQLSGTTADNADDPREPILSDLYEASELASSWNPVVGMLGTTLYADEKARRTYARYVLLRERFQLEARLESVERGQSPRILTPREGMTDRSCCM